MSYETNRDYHSDLSHVSNTMLGVYRKDGPAAYRKTFITREMQMERTAALLFGSLVDVIVLEPDRFDEEFLVVDASSRNTKKYRDAVKAEKAGGGTREGVLLKEVERAHAAAEAAWAFPDAAALLERMTQRQATYRWKDKTTGVKLRARLDMREPFSGSPTDAGDLKTTSKFRLWELVGARDYDYDMQAHTYSTGAAEAGEPIKEFFFLVVESSEPFRVRVCKVGPVWKQRGREKFEDAIQSLHWSMEYDSWLEPCQERVTVLGGVA